MTETVEALMSSWWWLLLAAMGVPAAITGSFIRRMEKRLDARERVREAELAERRQKEEKREQNREKLEWTMLQSVTAAVDLSEATAKAVQRIPDARCNGDMSGALEHIRRVKRAQKDFLAELGIHSLHEE